MTSLKKNPSALYGSNISTHTPPQKFSLRVCRESREGGGGFLFAADRYSINTSVLLRCHMLTVQLLTSYEGKKGADGFEAAGGEGGGGVGTTDTSHQGLYRIIYVCLCSVQCLLLFCLYSFLLRVGVRRHAVVHNCTFTHSFFFFFFFFLL